jgi:NADH-quinone oxidoreductase subunit J
MLPHRRGASRPKSAYNTGALVASLSLAAFLLFFFSVPGPFLATVFLFVFSIAAIVGGVLTVTSRNPIHSALWFASVVLATAGLFLLAGAPFLAAGTVIVYAGAIIVTFLFVIMLAQMEGKAPYDRAARSPGRATFTCFLLLGCLITALATLKTRPPADARAGQTQRGYEKALHRGRDVAEAYSIKNVSSYTAVLDRSLPPALLINDSTGAAKPNVAGLGESLYTVHLLSAGLAGVLLFVALVGAVAITTTRRPGQAAAGLATASAPLKG